MHIRLSVLCLTFTLLPTPQIISSDLVKRCRPIKTITSRLFTIIFVFDSNFDELGHTWGIESLFPKDLLQDHRVTNIHDKLTSEISRDGFTMKSNMRNTALQKQYHNMIQQCMHFLRVEYYRYEVTFGLYVMTATEKIVANTFVITSLLLLCWALWLYFPSLIFRKFIHFVWLLTGHEGGRKNADAGFLPRLESMTPANS